MHIVMTVNAAWNIWNFRRPLVEALIAQGHHVTVLAPHDETVSGLQALGCDFYPLKINAKGMNPLEGGQLVMRFLHAFRTLRPDVVLSYTIKNNIFGSFAARGLGVPFVPNVTGLGTAFLSGSLLQSVAEGFYRRAFRPLKVVFFQNSDDRDLFVSRGLVTPAQAQLLPGSGIDLVHFKPEPWCGSGEDVTFLMVARLLRDKGVMEYVDAARRVRVRCPGVRFQLLGATDAANRTAISAATVAGWHEEGVIEYLGTTSDVRPVIAAAQCVVLPSYREGAPRTLIEAAAMARPVIATNVPGCRDVVEDGVTGYLCEVRDADSLAASCERFLALSIEEKRAMGQRGRVRAEALYDQKIVVSAYQRVIGALT